MKQNVGQSSKNGQFVSVKPIELRFWEKVKIDSISTCWNWIGNITTSGYGQFRVGKKQYTSHRISYELIVGSIPEGLTLDHLCRNKKCVNPNHLEAVTINENLKRADNQITTIESKRTHCPKGHEYTPENTKICNKKRYCITCQKLRGKKCNL